jgi:hypothetical protein
MTTKKKNAAAPGRVRGVSHESNQHVHFTKLARETPPPNLSADVLLLRDLVPDVVFSILALIPETCDDINVEALDARAIAELVRQYNETRVHLNATITADNADCQVEGLTIEQHRWGYSVGHDDYVRMLVVPDLADTGLELKELRPEQVGCAFEIQVKASPGTPAYGEVTRADGSDQHGSA